MALTQSLVRELLQYSSLTGKLIWKHRSCLHFQILRGYKVWNGKYKSKLAFNTMRPDGYLSGGIFNKTYLTRRVVWLHVYGVLPEFIDHVNGVKTDNSISNLRAVSHSVNMKNQKRPINNTSGFVGVAFVEHAQKWTAQIRVEGVSKHLGYFETINEAVTARACAEKQNDFHSNHGRK